ncbi:Flagellar basal-body rod protein FlgG [Caprobacter fermentans]|uniref:Flagellar basal-body rod protein FlgG n=1 Tax=Caproicibacter fermentans TaxID=2576756 RepID=A0A6N8HVE5_9FIRM|nr:flagellar hook-basal body protein [Caproicibacter fermentans]MVB09756.1 Flagellar basal-body rod protein FlgG [Caproicibacter fermentans]QNK42361.1 flagellar hook-basal body protein [Caproicibacter fermentans]
MMTSFYTATAGAIAQEQKMDVTSNNIANASTQGYKPDKVSFADLLYTGVHGRETANSLKVGHGDRLDKTDTVFTQGSVQKTNRSLDYALPSENAFFAVRCTDGTVRFTRNGGFQLSENADGGFFLADSQGGVVLDSDGNAISVKNENDPQNVGVYSFKNCDGLKKTGGNYLEETAASGLASVSKVKPIQGSIEESTVDLADEMTAMISAQKAFAFNAKILSISDNTMQTVNNLR